MAKVEVAADSAQNTPGPASPADLTRQILPFPGKFCRVKNVMNKN